MLLRLKGNGAGDGIRTRDINLGKVALYQLSYSRKVKAVRLVTHSFSQMGGRLATALRFSLKRAFTLSKLLCVAMMMCDGGGRRLSMTSLD